MTAQEAYLRLHSYKIVGHSHKVIPLTVHEPKGETIVVEDGMEMAGLTQVGKATQLTDFFKLCQRDPRAAQYRYDEIPYKYWYVTYCFCLSLGK
jgi:hypothetical protein